MHRRIILEAINSKNISHLIDLAEKKFTLTSQQREQLIEKIEAKKCRQAAEEWPQDRAFRKIT
jgi:hypothetical protein